MTENDMTRCNQGGIMQAIELEAAIVNGEIHAKLPEAIYTHKARLMGMALTYAQVPDMPTKNGGPRARKGKTLALFLPPLQRGIEGDFLGPAQPKSGLVATANLPCPPFGKGGKKTELGLGAASLIQCHSRLIVLYETPTRDAQTGLVELLDELARQADRPSRSKADIDRCLDEERASWD